MQPSTEPTLHSWSRDEMLEFAVRRGTRLRRQRLVVRSAVAAVVVAVALPAVWVMTGDEQATRVGTTDAPSTTVADDAGPADSSGASNPAPAGVLAQPSSPAAATARGAKPSLPPATATPTTTTTAAVELPDCGVGEVSLTTETSKSQYGFKETVVVDAVITNASGHACALPARRSLAVKDQSGRTVFEAHAESSDNGPWLPGATIEETFRWDQTCESSGCTGGMANYGPYTAEVTWFAGRQYGPAAAGFTLGP